MTELPEVQQRTMNRRKALKSLAALASTSLLTTPGPVGTLHGRETRDVRGRDDFPKDVRITRAIGARLALERKKLVGKNSHRDVHGRTSSDFLVVVETNVGVTGLGVAKDNRDAAANIIGKDPFEFYRPAERAIISPLGRSDMPLWDLVAKLLEKPAYALFGGKGPERVPVYDGSIYFADLLPEFEARGIERILQEIDEGLAAEQRAFKVKIGRGAKWMPRDAGDRRDLDVLKAIRKHVGPDITILVDANNGYDLAGTKRFLEEAGPLDLGFVEEMFPDVVEQDLELKEFIKSHGWKTLVADGEATHGTKHFEPYVAARALDVVQPDMRAFGFTLELEMDKMLGGSGIRLAPHNWGSLVGFYMQVQLARGIETFFRAERDPLFTDVLVADGYDIKDGHTQVPTAPGFGLALAPGALGTKLKPVWEVTA